MGPSLAVWPVRPTWSRKKILGDFDQDAGTVAGHAVRVHRAAMPQCLKGLDTGFDDLTARFAVNGGDQTDAAGVPAVRVDDGLVLQPSGVAFEALDEFPARGVLVRIVMCGHASYSAATAAWAAAFAFI